MNLANRGEIPVNHTPTKPMPESDFPELSLISSTLRNEYPASTQKNIDAALDFAKKISRTEIPDDRFLRVARLYMSVSQVKI